MSAAKDRSILILEDEALLAFDLESILADHGYSETMVCRSVREAMQQLDSLMPDLAILDVNLGPGASSAAVASRLAKAGCPFAFVTSFTHNTIMLSDELKDAPIFSKPVVAEKLLRWIDERLSTS